MPHVYGKPNVLVGTISGRVPMDVARARALKPNLRVAFTGSLADSKIYDNVLHTDPTLDEPTETTVHQRYVLMKVERVEVIDIRTGGAVIWFGPTGDALLHRP